ncbi:MAG TPA: hypothetical protein VLT36_01165 [Candidatus Dormibacteraeota bacterium]|nr:hypothetical protein [Candidatus Dormibacteraeota bacterium]
MIVRNHTRLTLSPSVRANRATMRPFPQLLKAASDALVSNTARLMVTVRRFIPILLLLAFITGCASAARKPALSPPRPFNFASDTFAYSNGLVWEYRYDENGKWTSRRREPRPDYSQHCFVVSRSACQFFENAEFKPEQPKASEATYRKLIGQVVSTSLRKPLDPKEKIIIPGYRDLRSFSTDYSGLLQAECGGAWRCYFQRGNWRVVFPFSRHQQAEVADQLQDELKQRHAVVAHLVRFPQLSINHAVVIFEARSKPDHIEFVTYDPNDPSAPTTITYDRKDRTFYLPYNSYFEGGRVDVYSIYDRLLY